jgi:hypothetical protein
MRVLRRVEVCGLDFKVMAADDTFEPMSGASGLCDAGQAEIYIRKGDAPTVQIDTLFHELMHACIDATGLGVRIEAASEALGDESGAFLEELIVGTLSPALKAAIKSAGWREPRTVAKRPRGKK